MVVTVLDRIAKQDAGKMELAFKDVEQNKWYAKSVNWANKAGVVKGVSKTLFAPDLNVTREQLATMLYRFANHLGLKLSTKENKTFKDSKDVENYAKDAVNAMQNIGIITGRTDGRFDPKATASRGELAIMIQRFINFLATKK